MITKKEIESLEDLLVDEVRKVIKRGDIKDATEAKAVKDVVEALHYLRCMREGNDGGDGEYDNGGYSGAHMPNATRMPVRYGYSEPNMGYNRGSSGKRSSRTGRYISNEMMNDGYSGHSIRDRMIASLEDLYDNAGSQHEKTEIDNWIDRLRTE